MIARFLCLIVFTLIFSLIASAQTPENNLPRKPGKEPVTAKEWYEYARWSSNNEQGTPEKAMQALNKAIELQPNLIEALHMRGNLKRDAGDYKGAIEDFNTVIQFDPTVTNTYMLRAEVRLSLNPKDINGALVDYDLLINQLATSGHRIYSAFIGRSKLRYQKGDLDGAVEDIEQALSMRIGILGPTFLRALIYLRQGNDAAALADLISMDVYYQEVTAESRKTYPQFHSENESYPYDQNPLASLKPRSDVTGVAIGVGLSDGTGYGVDINGNRIKERTVKIRTFREKLSPDSWFDPMQPASFNNFDAYQDSSVWYYFLGELLEGKGETVRAEEAYTNAIITTKEHFPAHLNRGKIRLRNGKLEPAIRDFSWAIHYEPKLAEAYAERGLAILMLNHVALAQKDFDIYLKLEPAKSVELEKRIAVVNRKRKDAQRVISP